MTALEERLSKTEYIYVLGFDGKPQMPTRRKRHVLKLLKTGRARIAEDIPFTIRLTYRNAPVLQPVTLSGLDHPNGAAPGADTSEHHPEDQQVSAGHRHRI